MFYLILLLLVIFPLGQLGRLDISGSGIVLHLNDLLVGVIFLVYGLKTRFSLARPPLANPVLLWIAAIVGSLALNSLHLTFDQIVLSALYIVRWIAYAALFFAVASLSPEYKEKLRRLLPIPIVAVAIIGILQYLFLPDMSFLKAQNWDDHYFRVVSTFLDPGFTGIILVLGLLKVFTNIRTSPLARTLRSSLDVRRGAGLTNCLNFVSLALIYTAFTLTYSRASYLAYLVGFGVLAWYRRSVKLFVTAAIVLLITIPLLPKTFGEGTKLGRESSILARINNWSQSVEIWRTAPILGVGYNAYRFSLADMGLARKDLILRSHGSTGADSSILLVLATTGALGFLAYLNLGKKIVLSTKSALFLASLLAVFIHSWFNNTLFYPWIMEWLWLTLALGP